MKKQGAGLFLFFFPRSSYGCKGLKKKGRVLEDGRFFFFGGNGNYGGNYVEQHANLSEELRMSSEGEIDKKVCSEPRGGRGDIAVLYNTRSKERGKIGQKLELEWWDVMITLWNIHYGKGRQSILYIGPAPSGILNPILYLSM